MRDRSSWMFSPASKSARLFAAVAMLVLMVVGSACGDDIAPPIEQAPAITSFSAEPTSITAGESTTLSWTTTGTYAAEITAVDGDFSHTIASENIASGTLEVTPEETTTYVLTATRDEQETTEQVEVTVGAALQAPTVDSFEASPETIVEGESTTLSWTTTDAAELSLVDADGSAIDIADAGVDTGSVEVSPTEDTTYTLTATNEAGTDEQTVSVTVDAATVAPTINSFSISPNPALVGSTASVAWDVTGADTLTLESDADGAIDISGEPTDTGSIDVTVPDQETIVYTLTAENDGGTATQDFTLATGDAVTISSFTSSNSSPVVEGDDVTLSWTVVNATDVTLESDITGAIDITNLATPGQITLQPQETTTYTLTAQGLGGPATQTLTVEVVAPVEITDFAVTPTTVTNGSPVTISWTTVAATDLTLEAMTGSGSTAIDLTGKSLASDSVTHTPASDVVAYKLTADGANGPAVDQQNITVLVAADLVLSELFYDASGGDDGYEWVEIYNAGDTFVDLSNYSLGGGGTDYTYTQLDLSGTLAPGGCAVIGGPTSDATNASPEFFGGTGTNIDPDLQNGGTTADGVALFFATSANVTATTTPIDSVLYGDANSSGLLGEDGSADAELSPDVGGGSSIARVSPTSDVFVERTAPTPGRCFNISSLSPASAPAATSNTVTFDSFGLDPALDQYELEDDGGTRFVLTGCTQPTPDSVECTVPVLTSASSATLDLVVTRAMEYTPDANGDPVATAVAAGDEIEYRLTDAYTATPSYTIDWCNVQYPATTTQPTGATTTVYAQLYIAGQTDQSTAFTSSSIVAQLGVGADATDPATDASWTWTHGSLNQGFDFSTSNNDEYQATLTAPSTAGSYDYAYRFSGDGGQTWTYCDTNGSGDGYQPANAGDLTVN